MAGQKEDEETCQNINMIERRGEQKKRQSKKERRNRSLGIRRERETREKSTANDMDCKRNAGE